MNQLIAAILLATCLMAQAPSGSSDPTLSYDMRNGKAWQLMDQNQKNCYVLGFLDAERMIATFDDNPQNNWVYTGYSPAEIRDGVEALYKDPTTRTLPVPWAIRIVVQRFNGKSKAEIDALIQEVLGAMSGKVKTEKQ
jgi:hypothetical protein